MNNLIELFILGIIQGMTEFFPISSSGHLVIGQDILNISNLDATEEIIAHFGTLFSIIYFYRSSFFSKKNPSDFFHSENLTKLVLATIPAIIFALLFDVESYFNIGFVEKALLINGIWLILATILTNTFKFKLTNKIALLLGIFQSIAILPGISRSGAVICAALILGIKKSEIIKFCFYMVVPATILSIFYKLLFSSSGFSILSFQSSLVLFSSSFIFGYLSLVFLIKILEKFSFIGFGVYCIIVSFLI